MLKNISRLEAKIGDKVYHLLCDSDSPLEHVKESLLQFIKFVGQIEDQVKAAQVEKEKAEDEKVVPEEVKPEQV